MIRLFIGALVFWLLSIAALLIGQYGQFYDTSPPEMYAAVYYEEDSTDVVERAFMYIAAEYRCNGQLEEDFSCSTPNEKGWD